MAVVIKLSYIARLTAKYFLHTFSMEYFLRDIPNMNIPFKKIPMGMVFLYIQQSFSTSDQ